MASNKDKLNLKAFLCFISKQAIEEKINYFLAYEARNNSISLDLTRVDLDGSLCCVSLFGVGTAKDCFIIAENFLSNFDGREPLKKATRQQAKRMLMIAGVNFDLDFFQQRYAQQLLLVEYAKLTKYRRPAASNGSLARYFFKHLQTKIKL